MLERLIIIRVDPLTNSQGDHIMFLPVSDYDQWKLRSPEDDREQLDILASEYDDEDDDWGSQLEDDYEDDDWDWEWDSKLEDESNE